MTGVHDILLAMLRRLLICALFSLAVAFMIAQSADPKQPGPSQIYKPGNGVTPPRPIYNPAPSWSDTSRKLGIQGAVIIGGYVGVDGRFHDARILRSLHPSVDADALEGIKTWKFEPCTKEGQPVNCELKMEIVFRS
jgi:TonB family protein